MGLAIPGSTATASALAAVRREAVRLHDQTKFLDHKMNEDFNTPAGTANYGAPLRLLP